MVDLSASSYKFIDLKTCIEYITALIFKLRMFGIQLKDDGPDHVFCNNKSVYK